MALRFRLNSGGMGVITKMISYTPQLVSAGTSEIEKLHNLINIMTEITSNLW